MTPPALLDRLYGTSRAAALALLLVAPAACSDSPTDPRRPADPCEALPLPLRQTVTGAFGPDSCLAEGRRTAEYGLELPETSTVLLTASGIECLCVRTADGALVYETAVAPVGAKVQHLVLPAGRYRVSLRAASDTAVGEYRLTASVSASTPHGCVDGGVATTRGATVNGAITEDDCGTAEDLHDRYGVWLEAGQTLSAAITATDPVRLELHGQDERLDAAQGTAVSVRHTAARSDYYSIEVAGAPETGYTLSIR